MNAALSRKLRLVRLALLWERAWPPLAAAACLLALFLALALLDVAPSLPFWLNAALAPAFGAGVAVLVWRAWRMPRPTPEEAERRLERDSGALHRPLAVLADPLAAGDEELWRLHRARMARLIGRLSPGWPDPVLAARDPLGLRFAILLLLVIAAAGAHHDAPQRLARAIDPYSHRPALESDTLEVWIVPPAYTGLGQTLLKPGSGGVSVPAGSTARAVTSWRGWSGSALSAGSHSASFDADGRTEIPLTDGASLDVRLGVRMAASWPLTLRPDLAPTIALRAPPKDDERGRLSLDLEGNDDYGLTRIWVEIRPATGDAPPFAVDAVLPGDRPRQARPLLRLDLADHDWAGTEVLLTAKAEDSAGQTGSAPPVRLTLPQRIFHDPLARALIAWRRQLSDAPRLGPEIAGELRQVLDEPQSFRGDDRVALALGFTRHVLMRPQFQRDEMRSLLWYAATRIEDGGLPAAEKNLEDARSRLERALADKTDAAELSRLVAELEAAMEQWMDALAELGLDDRAPSPNDAPAADLADMMDELRGLAETGDREGLRRRLEQLRRMMAEMGPGRRGGNEGGKEAAEALRRLQDITRRQQDLLDDSFRRTAPPVDEDDMARPRRKPSKAEAEASRRAAEEQKALRQALEDWAKGLEQLPDDITAAQRSMRGAESSLGQGQWGDSADQQAEAVKRLQNGARQMLERLEAARGKGSPMLVPRDPFGRALNGSAVADDGKTKIPDRGGTMRAREILKELRRRSGDPDRPEGERHYLKRLLKPF